MELQAGCRVIKTVLYWDDFATPEDFAAALAALGPVLLEQVSYVLMSFYGSPVPTDFFPKRWRDPEARRRFHDVFAAALKAP
jgi:hypothetical protein